MKKRESLRDDSRDGGGRTKFGTRVEQARMFDPLSPTLSRWERELTGQQ